MTMHHAQPNLEALTYAALDPQRLRELYLIETLFVANELKLVSGAADRALVGAAVPGAQPLVLDRSAAATRGGALPRREWGIINIGEAGSVTVGGETFCLAPEDGLYIGIGDDPIAFSSANPEKPARFYIVSYPAHRSHPIRHVRSAEIAPLEIGGKETANERKIYKYFEPGRVATDQLVMGLTKLAPGSVWNTLPPHTHDRRSEVYLYFRLAPDQAVFHFMGAPDASRHLIVRNEQAVISPAWSMHFGCGTSAYHFIWCMGGENQDYTDMDPAPVATLK